MLRAFFGHHKCASTWVWQIIACVCRDTGRKHSLILDPQTPEAHGPLTDYEATFERAALGDYVRRIGADFVSCITADREQVEALEPMRGVHVIRDPRDIVVSAYFSHRNSHSVEGLPHLAAHRERLRAVSKEEGLLLEMSFSAQELEDLRAWDYGRPDMLELTMEDLTSRPYAGFLEVFEFLDLLSPEESYRMADVTKAFAQRARNRLATRDGFEWLRSPSQVTGGLLLSLVHSHRFEARARGRKVGEENPMSHYRKGVSGDWANHFTPEHVAAFKERYGDLLIQLGYEQNHDWGVETAPLVSS